MIDISISDDISQLPLLSPDDAKVMVAIENEERCRIASLTGNPDAAGEGFYYTSDPWLVLETNRGTFVAQGPKIIDKFLTYDLHARVAK